MAGGAGRLGNAGRVGVFIVPLVASSARYLGMGALGEFLRLVMTSGAIRCQGMRGGGAQ
jgi:hypothetical protein